MSGREERQLPLAAFGDTLKDGRWGLAQAVALPLSRGTAPPPPAVEDLRRCPLGKHIPLMIEIAYLRPRQWNRVRLSRPTVYSPAYLQLPFQPCREYPFVTWNRPIQLEFRPNHAIGECYAGCALPFLSLLQSLHRRHPIMEGTDTHFALRFDRRTQERLAFHTALDGSLTGCGNCLRTPLLRT